MARLLAWWRDRTLAFALARIPSGWAKVNGMWFRLSEYEDQDFAHLLPAVPLYELHDDDWSK